MHLEPGCPWPLGATVRDDGVNFALYSAHAEAVELCLYAPDGIWETARLVMPRCTDQVWHGFLPGARPWLAYGYRVHGPYDPGRGHRFNANKLLLDPYAKSWRGTLNWADPALGHQLGRPGREPEFDTRDNGAAMVKAVVAEDDSFPWDNDRPPRIPAVDTIIYEAHVKGLTKLHPDVPERLRGTYLGLAHPGVTGHLRRLGVTAIELLPVMAFLDEPAARARGLVNYWGYNTIGFFLPDARYALQDARRELKEAVKALHAAGIEVLLDVVFNHSGEGDEAGPTLSFRGIDNCAYYRLDEDDPSRYANPAGTGNAFDFRNPRVIQLAMDALRWWVAEYHIDGFRFDLATVLGREGRGFDPGSGFFDAIRQDPVLQEAKLIAEPWDAAPDGRQTGRFATGWSEWNDGYRDEIRRFWMPRTSGVGALADRLSGSSRDFSHDGRAPQATINFICSHDGFTLADLLSYESRRNLANGEEGRDGPGQEFGWNCGVEGPSEDPTVKARRERLGRALLATLFLSQGIPMLRAGDEMGQTQGGNNNPWCQDNATSWLDWRDRDGELASFVAGLARLRRGCAALRRDRFLTVADATWFSAEGGPVPWQDESCDALQMRLSALGPKESALLIVINRGASRRFVLAQGTWKTALETVPGVLADGIYEAAEAAVAVFRDGGRHDR